MKRRNGIARAAAIVAILWLPTHETIAQQFVGADRALSKPVMLAVSGGISLGAYQGGVNWGLTQFFRLTSNAQFRAKYGNHREFHIVGMTGASAGNMNSVFTSAEWCRAADRQDPESSLFRRAWTSVGWEQLYPQSPELREGSVYHRHYFNDVLFKDINKRLSNAQRLCDVPVGIVTTKAHPDSVLLTGGSISVPVQRVVSVVELRASVVGSSARFEQPTFLVGHQTLGDQIWLSSGDAQSAVIPTDTVLGLSAASGAYPIAFAQKHLSYYRQLPLSGACPPDATGRCAAPEAANFADGGVFDNDPLGFANDLFDEIRARPAFVHEYGANVHPWIIFISPDRRRLEDQAARAAAPIQAGAMRPLPPAASAPPKPVPESQGLAAAWDLVGNAVTSGRKYELFALSRSLAKANADVPVFGVTDRYQNAVGDYFNAFGAFLGRPFREYDFYVGVFDAMLFAAREVACGGFHDPDVAVLRDMSADVTDPARTRDCARTQLRAMITDPSFGLNPVGQSTLAALYAAEFPGLQPLRTEELRDAGDSLRVASIQALVGANERIRAAWTPARELAACSGMAVIESLACSGGFAQLLTDYANAPSPRRKTIRALVDSLSSQDDCAPKNWRASPDNCFADRTLASLLDNPTLALSRLTLDIFDQLSATEDALRTERNERPIANGTNFLYRAFIAPRYQRGWHLSESLLPRDISRWWYAIPYDFAINVASGGKPAGAEAGYRATYSFANTFDLVFPARFMYQNHVGFASLGAGLASKAHISVIPLPLEVTASTIAPPGQGMFNRTGTVIDASIPVLSFRIGYRQLMTGDIPEFGRTRSMVTVGLNAIGGQLFWLVH